MMRFVVEYGLNRRMGVLLFTATVMGSATALVENLLFLFMSETLHASYFLMGVSVVVTVSIEVPLFAFSKSLLSRVGTKGLLLGAMFAYVTRVTWYTLSATGLAVLAVEPLHGVTYALLQSAFVTSMARLAPPWAVATGQGLISLAIAAGRLVGTVAGGAVLESFGSTVMYRSAALVVAVNAVLVGLSSAFEGEGSTTFEGGRGSAAASPPPREALRRGASAADADEEALELTRA